MRMFYARASSTTQAEAFERAYMAATTSIRLKILLSFHYYQGTNLDELVDKKFGEHPPEIFVDSGGFSAKTQGAQIDLGAYIEFLRRYQHRITVYANLDVIGDPVATLANQKRMEDAGLRPLPVFHTGEPWEQLEEYIDAYPYIALGGMVPFMRRWRKLMPWLVRAYKMAKGRTVFHGFGATAWGVVKALPWYSVDSSSWSSSFRFGVVPLFDVRRGEWESAQLGDPKSCMQNAALFRAHGFDAADFADRARNKRELISAVSALAYIRAERWLRQRHGDIQIPERAPPAPPPDTDPGLRIYLAGTAAAAAHHRDAAELLGEHGVDAPPGDGGPRIYLANTDELHFTRASATLNGMAPSSPPPAGPRVYLADPAPAGNAKDTAAVNAVLNGGPRLYLADTSGSGACDTAAVTRTLNKEEPPCG